MSGRAKHLQRNRQFRKIAFFLYLPILFINWIVWIGVMNGMWLGDYIEPDMDLEAISGSEWAIIKRFSVLGWLWVMYSYPYAKAMKHRSFWSHAPVVSTAIRWAYFIGPILFLMNYYIPASPLLLWGLGVFLGLVVTDTAHWAEDNV